MLGMQQKEVLTVLLKGEQALGINNSIEYMDMRAWKHNYDQEKMQWNNAWFQEKLNSIFDAINYQESQSFIGETMEACPQGSKQWQLKVAAELWDEFVTVDGVIEQLSRYALYDLPNMIMTLSPKERSSIVGGVKGWEESSELVNQVPKAININGGNQLAKVWNGFGFQMNEDYGIN